MKKLFLYTAVTAIIGLTSCSDHKTQKVYYASGNLAQTLEFKNQLHNGKAVRYRDTEEQKIWEVIDFVDNKKQGKWLKFHENGQKVVEETYQNDILNGTSTEWYANGQIKSLKHYQNGTLQGKCLAWYENGVKKMEMNYIDGQIAGKIMEYDLNGKLIIDAGEELAQLLIKDFVSLNKI